MLFCSQSHGRLAGLFGRAVSDDDGGDALGDDGDGAFSAQKFFGNLQRLLQIFGRVHLHGANQSGVCFRHKNHMEAA